VPPTSGLPAHPDARLTRLGSYLATRDRRFNASAPLAAAQPLGVFGAGDRGRGAVPADAVWVGSDACALGFSGRGRCMRTSTRRKRKWGWRAWRDRDGNHACVCVDGAFGDGCERVCSNDCFNGCSGHGTCVHSWCNCDPGWYGVDCSDAVGLPYRRASLTDDRNQFGEGPRGAQLALLPPALRAHAARLRQAVFVYNLPPEVNRAGEAWMARSWVDDAGRGCDPVHNWRIYSAQSHFDAHLLHDDFARTADPDEASLYYVPLFLNQRVPWGADLNGTMLAALWYIQQTHPWWNASRGRDHVWFVFGERQTCLVPKEISNVSIIIGHWGDEDCMANAKDVVVPTITPVQHDYARYVHGRDGVHSLQRSMRAAADAGLGRNGPLLFFAGGITSFGASQDNRRASGDDTEAMQSKWLQRVAQSRCAQPDVTCRGAYSMGVRQAVWRQRLYAEADMRIVSAGVPDYLDAVSNARFCLHTEGNGWGARVVDYMAMECLPLMLNDRMLFPFENVLPWAEFLLHLKKSQIPSLASTLRNISEARQRRMRTALRLYKRGFVWWRPEGLAYEFTLAALGQRVEALGLQRRTRKHRAP